MDRIGEPLIYLVRHANVAADTGGLIRGLTNPSLDEEGEQQAKELGDWFSTVHLQGVYTDDLNRTYETALPIADQWGLTIERDPRLRSWDVGPDLENHSIEANRQAIKELKLQPEKVPVGGQSWGNYVDQIHSALDSYISLSLENAPIALVLHGSGIAVIAERLGAMEPGTDYEHTFVEPAGIGVIYLLRNGLRMLALKGAKEVVDA